MILEHVLIILSTLCLVFCEPLSLFVGPGFGSFGESEILPLPLGSGPSCQIDLPVFDYKSLFMVGGTAGDQVVLCGGLNNASECRSLGGDGQWKSFPSMNYRRNAALSVTLGNGNLVVVGGYDEYQEQESEITSEIFDLQQQKWVDGPQLPLAMEALEYCITRLNDTHFFVAGYDGSFIADETGFLWGEESSIIDFYAHSCALMPDGRVMAVGGFFFGFDLFGGYLEIRSLDNVVIFDPETLEWSEGPRLPVGLMAPSLVADGKDMLVMGGFEILLSTDDDEAAFNVHNEIYRFSTEEGSWKSANVNLNVERSSFPAFILDSEHLDCKGQTELRSVKGLEHDELQLQYLVSILKRLAKNKDDNDLSDWIKELINILD